MGKCDNHIYVINKPKSASSCDKKTIGDKFGEHSSPHKESDKIQLQYIHEEWVHLGKTLLCFCSTRV
jgi:hypothetical protein